MFNENGSDVLARSKDAPPLMPLQVMTLEPVWFTRELFTTYQAFRWKRELAQQRRRSVPEGRKLGSMDN